MGVYIPDMKMPKNCKECPMLSSVYESYGCVIASNGVADRYFLKSYRSRPEWCPLRRAGKEE